VDVFCHDCHLLLMTVIGGTVSRHSRRGSAFWLLALRNCLFSTSCVFIWHLNWRAQLVAWPVSVGILMWLTVWGRSRAQTTAPPVPGAGELLALELPVSGRTGDLAAAAPVRAAGSLTVTDAIRNSRQAGSWHPAGDPEADRDALLAGQAFRVTALRRNDRRWASEAWRSAGSPSPSPGSAPPCR